MQSATNDRKSDRQSIHARITASIVRVLESGARPWTQPWSADDAAPRFVRPRRHNGEPYRGINVLSLWAAALEGAYASPLWMTYRQALALGGQVRKGEKGTPVIYTNTATRTGTDDATGEESENRYLYVRGYTVFNVAQIDNLPDAYRVPDVPALPEPTRIAHADAAVAATGARILHGGNRACYRPSRDVILMPSFDSFRDAQSYYATLSHELVHWTGHESRLARGLDGNRFGDAAYAMEELVAELGSAFFCAYLQLGATPDSADAAAAHIDEHAGYIACWLKVLKNDDRAIFTAAAQAEKAAGFILPAAASQIIAGMSARQCPAADE
ncbi:MAG: ArdC family protein [Rhodospirillaceae bacterium]